VAWHSDREGIHGLWRLGLRHLRRLFLSRQERHCGRRRQLRGRGGALSFQSRRTRDRDPSPRLEFRAEKILQQRLFDKDNIDVIWDTEVVEYLGAPAKPPMPASVNGVRLKNRKTGDSTDMPIDGVFVAIGHAPAVSLFKDKLKHKPNGYLWTAPDSTATDVPGVFAAGDVTDDIYRQAVTAAGMGCMAALEAERYLAGHVRHAEAAE
jgi:thioredoxin reductase (NADPH)